MLLLCQLSYPVDALSSGSSEFGSSARNAATVLKAEAKAAISRSISVPPNANSKGAGVPSFRGLRETAKSNAERDLHTGVCLCGYHITLGLWVVCPECSN